MAFDERAPFGLAEVQPAGQLAHEEHIYPGELLWAQRRCGDQIRVDRHGPQVSKDAHAFAQGEQPLLGAHLGRWVVPFWPADRAEQHGVRLLAGGQGFIGQRRAVGVDRAAADQVLRVGD